MLSKNLLIGHRIALAFAIPVLALLSVGYFSLRNLDAMQRESGWVSHTIEVMAEVRSFSDALSRIDSSGRGYVLTGDEPLKTELAQQRASADASLSKLQKLTADNPIQQERLDQIRPLLNQRGVYAQELVSLRDTGAYRDSARVVELVRTGQKTSQGLRELATAMSNDETELLSQRRVASVHALEITRNTVVYGSIAALLVVGLGGFLLNLSITRPLFDLRNSATRIGKGDYAHRAPVEREDETGYLARVFNTMAAQVQERQEALAEQDWLKGSVAKFSGLFQRQRDPAQLGATVLSELATLLDAPHSVLYRVVQHDGVESLELTASYAAENPPARLARGEGLVGQCLAEGRRIVLSTPSSDYLRISSGLGAARPATILVEPVSFEGKPKAVLELASFKTFTPLQLQFIERLAESMGILLQTIEAVTRTEQLLAESQALAKQLADQQKALAEKNSELETQADHLRKSELLLQEQQVELTQTNEELEQTNEELQQSNEEMEEKSNLLATQKHELELSNRAIEQARLDVQEQARQLAITSKYKSDFLATMSHELRTPLNSLLILSRLLGENREQNLNAKQVQYAKTIESSGADLLDMINQILDLAKIESGTVELQLDNISPAELKRTYEDQFRHVAESRKLQFDVNVESDLPELLTTDVRRLHQVLKNLLSNAFKFTERGSVKVDIRRARSGWKYASSSLDTALDVLAISVTDTGIGIAKEKQQIVFESFQQADAGTSRRFGGTGLGLTISREIATLLGGVLQLQSEPGKGSTFTLFIPATVNLAAARAAAATARQPVRQPPSTSTDTPRPASTSTPEPPVAELAVDEPDDNTVEDDRGNLEPSDRAILIIEDDDRFARILVDFAREKRFKAIVARSARQGLALAQRHVPVAITLDLRLVDEDGWVVLDRLKHDARTRHIPVHVISVEPARGRGLRLGAVSYLQKPVSKEAINEILQQTVDFIERPVKNLLVIEDDAVQRNTIKELIGNGDVKTTTVGTASEALAALTDKHFDCIVLDLMLPDMTGVELIRQINQRLGLQAPPIIVYTGKDLTSREETELRSLSESIIVKDARSPERLLDETALFLHRVQARLPEAKRRMLEQVRKQDAVLSGRRVLVVDDDVRNIFALTAALEGYGMIVKFAESGQAAIDALEADPSTEIVLMDVMMPGMDGNEAIRRLRKDSRFARLPIISVTAKAMKGDRERCIEAGASDYITKPVDTEKLLSLLRVWLYR